MPNPRPNPYIGPRSFRTGETMYGRERETLELLDLIIAERIVLLYSPSGAGKTSLIQAALVPKLREDGFFVLRPLRVSAKIPDAPSVTPPRSGPEAATSTGVNRFVLSTLLSLEEPLAPELRMPTPALSQLTLDGYLKQRADLSEKSLVFIFDQFEEVLTLDPTNLDAKFAFFEQVGEALRDRSRWALFSMREDYLAGLDPYVKPVPTRFGTTYRLDLLGVNAAREAIQKPARNAGVDFTEAAAVKLTDDLRRIQVQRPDGTMETQPGLYVEPVQLQVVCFRLWDKLPEAKTAIVESDIADVGDVNTALGDYYAATVRNTAASSGESEREIREWFDRQLITEQGIRGQVLMEPGSSRGLSNKAIGLLEDAHLVRADERRGATWFELAHDRLIEPIRASNAIWFRENLSPLQQQADLWERQGRPDSLLLRDQALVDAETWAGAHPKELTPIEESFLSESRGARLAVEREKKQNQRIRWLAIGASILSLLALVAFIIALTQFGAANASAENARNAQATAVANEQEAQRQREEVVTQDRVSKMVSSSLSQLEVDPEVSMLLATEAFKTSPDLQTDDALRQSVIASRLRETFSGHSSGLLNAAISPDDTRLATASSDGTARLWDMNSGELTATLSGHEGTVWSVAFSPDGALLTTTDDSLARIWDANCLATGGDAASCVKNELQGHDGPVLLGSFSPDGSRLATASADMTAIVWDLASGAQEQVLRGHTGEVNSAQFSPDGKQVVTASADQTLRVWDLENCAPDCPFQELTGPAGAIWSASYSPDGQSIVAASDDQNAYEFDVANGSVVTYLVGHTDIVYGAAFSPDGKHIVTASADGTARLWDANYGTLLAVLRGHGGNVNSVAFNSDGELIATASDDGTAKLWNEGSGTELKTLRGHTNKVFSVDFSPNGELVVTSSQDGTAGVWDSVTGEEVFPPLAEHEGWVLDAAYSPDGMRIVTSSDDGTLRLWDMSACNQAQCPSIPIQMPESTARQVEYSPDGTRILTAGSDGILRLWDAATGSQVDWTGPTGAELKSAIYNSDASRIAAARADGTAQIIDAASGQLLSTLSGHGAGLTSAAFSPDGTWLVTGSQDRTARVWDASTGVEKLTLQGHNGAVNGVAISPDGTFILSASTDKTARLWNAATGDQLGILRGHLDGLTDAAFSPDGKFVATSSSDRTARITLTNIQDIYALSQTRATRQLSCNEWTVYLQESGYCPLLNAASGTGAVPLATRSPGALVAAVTRTPLPSVTSPPTSTFEPTTELATATPTPTEPATIAAPTPLTGETAVGPTEPPTATLEPTPESTPTPLAPPGVYAMNISFTALDPNAKPTQLIFTVNFFNNTGSDANFARWRVLVFRQGERNSIGDPSGLSKTIPNGESEKATEPWRINVGICENFVAQPAWEDNIGARTLFTKPDGSEVSVQFQVCP